MVAVGGFILNLGVVLFLYILILIYFKSFVPLKEFSHPLAHYIFVFLICILTFIFLTFSSSEWAIIPITIIMTFFMSFLFEGKPSKKFTLFAVFSLFFTVTVGFFYYAFNFVLAVSSPDNVTYEHNYQASLISLPFIFSIVKMIFTTRVFRKIYFNFAFMTISIITPLTAISSMLMTSFINPNSISWFFIPSMILGCLYIDPIIFYFMYNMLSKYKTDNTTQKLKHQMEYQTKSYEKTSLSFTTMRLLVHDANKHMIYLRECARNEQSQEGISYIDGVIESAFQKNLSASGDTIIDSLVANLYDISHEYNIKLTTDIEPISKGIDISTVDFCACLGILFDKAIVSCQDSDSEDRFINLKIAQDESQFLLQIDASSDTDFDATGDLLNIENLVAKNNGTFKISSYYRYFSATITLKQVISND